MYCEHFICSTKYELYDEPTSINLIFFLHKFSDNHLAFTIGDAFKVITRKKIIRSKQLKSLNLKDIRLLLLLQIMQIVIYLI